MSTRTEFKAAYEPTIRAVERGRLSDAESERALRRLRLLRDGMDDDWDRRSAHADVAAVERAVTRQRSPEPAPPISHVRANRLLSHALTAPGAVEDRLSVAMGAHAEMEFVLRMAPADEQAGVARMMLSLSDHIKRLRWEQRKKQLHA